MRLVIHLIFSLALVLGLSLPAAGEDLADKVKGTKDQIEDIRDAVDEDDDDDDDEAKDEDEKKDEGEED